MKRIFSLLAIATACVAMASCQKGVSYESLTFMATTTDTKVGLDGTSYSWEVGDVLYFCSDVAGQEPVKIELTENDINGKTAMFKVDKAPSSASYYFLYAFGKNPDVIKSVNTSGVAEIAAIPASASQGENPVMKFVAVGSCLKGNSRFNMQNVLVPVRFTLVEKAQKVVLEGLGGEVLMDDLSVKANGTASMKGTNPQKSLTAVLGKTCQRGYFYLAPDVVMKGCKLSVYSDDTTLMYEVEYPGEMTATRGSQLSLGSVEEPDRTIYYADEWEAGREIVIEAQGFKQVYSKAASGLTAKHVTAKDATAGVYTIPEYLKKTILFVDPDVIVNLAKENGSNTEDVVIVGNESGNRSTMSFGSQQFNAYGYVTMKNMKLINCNDLAFNNECQEFEFILDDCYFTLSQNGGQLLAPTKNEHPENLMKKTVIVNCDWDVTAPSQKIINFYPYGPSPNGDIVFCNNVIYYSASKKESKITAEFTVNATNVNFTNVIVVGNTFLNVSGPTLNHGFIQTNGGVTNSINIDKNLIYIEGTLSDVITSGKHHFMMLRCLGATMPKDANISNKTADAVYLYQSDVPESERETNEDGTISTERTYLNMWLYSDGGNAYQFGWTRNREENPFEFVSVTQGKFEIKSKWADYGAKR